MDNSTYLAVTKQVQLFERADVLANNVANANTPSFKQDKVTFDKFLTQDVNEKISFPRNTATMVDLKEGPLNATQRALDVAISGEGFFMVRTSDGMNKYTRNGNFHVNAESTLVDSSGNSVLSGDGQEIVFEEGDGAPTISEDGTVLVNNEERGVIGVVTFNSPQLLRKSPEGLLTTTETPQIMETPKILQSMLEGSNVNSIQAMTELVRIQENLSMTSKLIESNFNMELSSYKVYSKIGG